MTELFAPESLFMAQHFSNWMESLSFDDIFMNPTANGHKNPKFSMRKREQKEHSKSILELFKLEE